MRDDASHVKARVCSLTEKSACFSWHSRKRLDKCEGTEIKYYKFVII